MKRTTGILVCTLAAGMAWAQSPEIIQNTRAKMDTVVERLKVEETIDAAQLDQILAVPQPGAAAQGVG